MSWPLVKFKDVATVVTGSTPKKNDENYGGNIPFVTPGDLGEKSEIDSAKVMLSASGANSARLLPANSVMVCCIGATIGKTGLAVVPVVTNQQINSLVFDSSKVFSKYAFYFCQTLTPLLRDRSTSTTMPIVNKSSFSEFEIPLPPLPEQKRIAAILDKADAIRRKRQQAIQLADEFLRAVFLDMFGDPVSNPKGWEVKPIDELCSEIVDCVNRTAPTVDYPTPYKMIRTTNVRDYSLDIDNVRYVDEETYKKWVRRLVPKRGDIIFTREAPAGEAAVINTSEKIFLGQRTMHFRPNQTLISSEYLMFELMSGGVKRQISRMHAGSTVTHLSVPECKKFEIRVPPLKLQRNFEAIKNAVLSTTNRAEVAFGSPLFESLSQKAFLGLLWG